jgi:hypothetical protein
MAMGLPLTAALSRLIASRMHGLGLLDPATYVVVPLVSFSVALCAVLIPARRAAAHPMDALRID